MAGRPRTNECPLLVFAGSLLSITEILQFECLGLILDPKLTMHLATTEAIRRAAHGQSVTQAVSSSLRYDKNRSQLNPTQNLGLWKSNFLQNELNQE